MTGKEAPLIPTVLPYHNGERLLYPPALWCFILSFSPGILFGIAVATYNFKWIGTDLHVLIKIDESSYTGGGNGADHPMAWYHQFDGGRGFYTALGHDNKSWEDPLYLKHVLGGILYAIGTTARTK